jgi:hypothetical protein
MAFFTAPGVTNVHVNQTGYTQSTDLVPSLDNGPHLQCHLTTSSYMQRWQLALQRQLPGNNLIEVSYVGNRGTRMQVSRDLNPTPAQYLSTCLCAIRRPSTF